MNNTTKNDLSFNEVKLDYKALITTAEVAISGCIENINRHMNIVREASSRTDSGTELYLHAKWLSDNANLLAICADTLAALKEGEKRNIVTIVNKDEINKCPECNFEMIKGKCTNRNCDEYQIQE
jgi:hypothetical protein